MVKHIVCFKLKDGSKESCEKAREVLLGMKGNVSLLKNIDVHIDELHSPRSYDVMLEVVLDSWEDLDAYQNDPYHCGVVKKYMHAVRESSIAMDYSF